MELDVSAVDAALRTKFVGRRLVCLSITTSTQDVAREEAEAGAVEGTVVFAEEQTAGRGRFGRAWMSPVGRNLYLTLVLRPDVARLRVLGMLAPLAVAQAVEETTRLAPRVKWPNDVLLSGRKFCGVLIDSEFAGAEPRYALVGIGVNVNYDVDQVIADVATSMKAARGRDTSREVVLAALLNRIEALYEEPTSVRAQWRERLETLGREVKVTFRGEVFEGVAEDVDEAGNLLLRLADGTVRTFEAGEVSLRG